MVVNLGVRCPKLMEQKARLMEQKVMVGVITYVCIHVQVRSVSVPASKDAVALKVVTLAGRHLAAQSLRLSSECVSLVKRE